MKDEDYMQLAIEQALVAKKAGDYPFGAIIVSNERIVGRGKAENNTGGDVTEHAELLAVKAACKTLGRNKLNDCTIYCTGEPCTMCAAAIFQADIPRVVLATERSDLSHFFRPRRIMIHDLADDQSYKIEIVTGVLKEKVLKLFDDVKR